MCVARLAVGVCKRTKCWSRTLHRSDRLSLPGHIWEYRGVMGRGGLTTGATAACFALFKRAETYSTWSLHLSVKSTALHIATSLGRRPGWLSAFPCERRRLLVPVAS
jgi:hypothetical protein